MNKIITFINGFCMALADSVPGVSGGTVAFLMGFYDNFIGALDNIISGNLEQKKNSVRYLFKLGIGWITGFGLAVVILSNLFEANIYRVSSLFIGFIIFAIPLVIYDEKNCLKANLNKSFFVIVGILVVTAITYFNPVNSNNGFDLVNPGIFMYIYVFAAGAISICAMILPGISGSTLLLIFGLYLPVMSGIKNILSLDFSSLPIIAVFGLGVITGVVSVIKIIKKALEKYRGATIYLILGLMIGSLYAVIMGPTTLDIPQPQLTMSTFSLVFFVIGGGVIIGMQLMKTNPLKKYKQLV